MKRHFKNLLSVMFSIIKFSFIKIFNGKNFKFHWIERFSPNTEIDIGRNSELVLKRGVRAHGGTKLRVRNGGRLIIGENTAFNYRCIVTSHSDIQIGKNTIFGPNVLVYDHDHDFRNTDGIGANKYKISSVTIGDNVWIGANSIILRGTRIGNNCVVGAGSIIRGEFPDNSVIVQKRNTEVIKYS